MEKLINFLKKRVAPALNKINQYTWLVSIRDSFNQIMPFIYLASVLAMLTIPARGLQIDWWPDFWCFYDWAIGLIAPLVAFLIPFNLMEKNRLKKYRFIAGISGVTLYGITVAPGVISELTNGFERTVFGPAGLFIAVVTGIGAGMIIRYFGKIRLFKEDSSIPDFVRFWPEQLLPIAIVVCGGYLLVGVVGIDLARGINAIFNPLQFVTETFWGFLAIDLFIVILYSMGISAWVLTPLTTPLKLMAITANSIVGAANVFTSSFQYAYLCIGGTGCTLGLALWFLFSKSQRLSKLGKAAIVPSIFNINEPIVFGAVVWNPLLMVPMVLNSFVYCSIAWVGTKVFDFAPIPDLLFQFWYLPYPISTWLATGGSIAAVGLVLIIFLATTMVWYPFFKVYEKNCCQNENEEN